MSDATRRAMRIIERLEARLEAVESATRPSIAIVGMAGRFPTGAVLDDFWASCLGAMDGVGRARDRGTGTHPIAGWLPSSSIDGFDCEFFRISPREARAMDPQHRLLLELTYEALADAGIPASSLRGQDGGVFFGLMNSDHALRLARVEGARGPFDATGCHASFAAGRVSYLLGLNGPSEVVDTACSSSLVAVHHAINSLRRGECDLAVVGGANLILDDFSGSTTAVTGALSPTHRCRVLDAGADGFVRGEGGGVVILQRVDDARAQGRAYDVVLRGSAVNHDGRAVGLTHPNGRAQAALLRRALEDARVAAGDVDVVELHGTGTRLGDPIEVAALREVLDAEGGGPCSLSAGKSHLGHLEGAAGIAGLIRLALILRHRQVPPNLHFRTLNPHIGLDGSRLEPATGVRSLERPPRTCIGGVSSFGLSGTNAHVVAQAECWRADHASFEPGSEPCILPVSATNRLALIDQLDAWVERPRRPSEPALPELCAVAAHGRDHLPTRVGLVAASLDELDARVVEARAAVRVAAPDAEQGGMAWLCTGQGSIRPGVARELYAADPRFRRAFDVCDEHLRRHHGVSAVAWIRDGKGASSRPLSDTAIAQPLLVCISWSIARSLRALGLRPDYVAGHSVGEIAAACIAGAFGIAEALDLAMVRGAAMGGLAAEGGMLAVACDPVVVEPWLGPELTVAAINGRSNCVVSGSEPGLRRVEAELARSGIDTRRLDVSHAFHSPLVAPSARAVAKHLRGVVMRPLEIPLVSCLDAGIRGRGTVVGGEHWARHVVEPVRYLEAVERLWREGVRCFIELGPDAVLTSLGRARFPTGRWYASQRRRGARDRGVLQAAADAYGAGFDLDWDAVVGPPRGRGGDAPGYRWRRQPVAFGGSDGPSQSSPSAPVGDEREWIVEVLVTALGRALGLPAPGIDRGRSMADLGLDSLVGVELRAEVGAVLGLSIPNSVLWKARTVDRLADLLHAHRKRASMLDEIRDHDRTPPESGAEIEEIFV